MTPTTKPGTAEILKTIISEQTQTTRTHTEAISILLSMIQAQGARIEYLQKEVNELKDRGNRSRLWWF